jgi:arylsulfatase A-like enzyme
VRSDLARHYNNIHRMDEQVAAILDRLAEEGLADSTIVIWTSDHGDGLPRAKREVYDSGIRVPLLVYWPPGLRPEGVAPGSVDERLISFVDLAPTILRMAGVEAPQSMVGRVFTPPAQSGPPRAYVYASKDRMNAVPDLQRSVRDTRFKYIRNGDVRRAGAQPQPWRDVQDGMRAMWSLRAAGRLEGPPALWFEPRAPEELYDTSSDPHEVVNLAGDPARAAELERLRGALDDWLARTWDSGAIPESELRERSWPGGVEPLTPPPVIRVDHTRVALAPSEPGATVGYRRIGGGSDTRWRLYTAPFQARRGERIEAKAVRYGWAESTVVSARIP